MKLLKSGLLAVAISSITAGNAWAEEVTLRLHHFLPAQAAIPSKVIEPWARKLEADSNGRIKVQIFPAMQMGGSPVQLFDQARDGVVDISWAILGYMPGRFVKSDVFELPFLAGRSAEQSSKALWEFSNLQAADEFKEVKLLATFTQGPGVFHSRQPIHAMADIKGMKVRGGTRIINQMLSRVGATPVPVPVPQTAEALSKGVVEATTLSWEVAPPLKVIEMVKHHTDFSGDKGLYTAGMVIVMNKESYAKLPEDLKKVVDSNSGAAFSARFGQVMDEGDRAAKALAVKKGNEVVMLDAAETQRWREAAQPVRAEWIKELKGKGIDGQKLIDDVEALLVKHAPKGQ
ncbi:TRAP transporter substrate-binding protein [Hydrogenophaga sp. 5NK40-0174]|uniref:TRAP transporter substrate-binding protein n=1 Tax=Hydrogenophaga sp. 5NK40-0174 TaxID=3127649 RepID=UPI003102A87C